MCLKIIATYQKKYNADIKCSNLKILFLRTKLVTSLFLKFPSFKKIILILYPDSYREWQKK